MKNAKFKRKGSDKSDSKRSSNGSNGSGNSKTTGSMQTSDDGKVIGQYGSLTSPTNYNEDRSSFKRESGEYKNSYESERISQGFQSRNTETESDSRRNTGSRNSTPSEKNNSGFDSSAENYSFSFRGSRGFPFSDEAASVPPFQRKSSQPQPRLQSQPQPQLQPQLQPEGKVSTGSGKNTRQEPCPPNYRYNVDTDEFVLSRQEFVDLIGPAKTCNISHILCSRTCSLTRINGNNACPRLKPSIVTRVEPCNPCPPCYVPQKICCDPDPCCQPRDCCIRCRRQVCCCPKRVCCAPDPCECRKCCVSRCEPRPVCCPRPPECCEPDPCCKPRDCCDRCRRKVCCCRKRECCPPDPCCERRNCWNCYSKQICPTKSCISCDNWRPDPCECRDPCMVCPEYCGTPVSVLPILISAPQPCPQPPPCHSPPPPPCPYPQPPPCPYPQPPPSHRPSPPPCHRPSPPPCQPPAPTPICAPEPPCPPAPEPQCPAPDVNYSGCAPDQIPQYYFSSGGLNPTYTPGYVVTQNPLQSQTYDPNNSCCLPPCYLPRSSVATPVYAYPSNNPACCPQPGDISSDGTVSDDSSYVSDSSGCYRLNHGYATGWPGSAYVMIATTATAAPTPTFGYSPGSPIQIVPQSAGWTGMTTPPLPSGTCPLSRSRSF